MALLVIGLRSVEVLLDALVESLEIDIITFLLVLKKWSSRRSRNCNHAILLALVAIQLI